MQAVLLEVFQQGPAGTMHNAFRRSRGARREQDEQRVVERVTLPDKIAGEIAAYQIADNDGKPPATSARRAAIGMPGSHGSGRKLPNSTAGASGANRAKIAKAPISCDQLEKTAPIAAVASAATTTSTLLRPIATTRSPLRTPKRLSAAANPTTSLYNWRRVSRSRVPPR